jgi:hypothetical protein
MTQLHNQLDQVSPPVVELMGKEWTRDSSPLQNQRRGFTTKEDELLIELCSLGLT